MTRVLILDDRPINRQYLTTLLSYRGFETREAGDGREGLRVVEEWHPDLAIVDIAMPVMDGFEFASRLRNGSGADAIPVIFYTATYDIGVADRMARECGVEHVLMKPSEPEQIFETIERALGAGTTLRNAPAVDPAEFARLHADAMRTSALIDFQLEIAVQRQPEDILSILSRTAPNIITSEGAVVTLAEGASNLHCREHLQQLLAEGRAVRTAQRGDCAECAMLQANVNSYLGVPIVTLKRGYGWLSLVNREGGPFSIEDERIALTLAAQTAIAYENLLLCDKMSKDLGLLRATIEDRVRAEKALRASEEKYRSLVANTPNVIWTADEHGHVTFISPNIESMYGFSAAEVLENSDVLWRDRVHPDDCEATLAAYADLFAGRAAFNCEYRIQHRDGRWIWVHGSSNHTYQRNGVLYADGIVHDVTARKEAEAELRRVARDRELLLESTGDGIYAVDNDGRCTMANRVAASLLGRTLDEMIGSPIHELIHRREGAFRAEKPSRVTDEEFRRKDGSTFPVEYVSAPIVDAGVVRGTVVTFADVTEQRRLERRVEQASRVDSLGRMAATIAHEFNNVLMGIQPFAEVIRKRASGEAPFTGPADHILNAVSRGKAITQDILGMTRTAEPDLQSIELAVWLQQCCAEIRAFISGGIKIDVQLPREGVLHARFDPAQMQQVLTNLALNARDAMRRGGGTLTISASRAMPFVRLTIADSGCGITAETLPFIFEPLFTTKQSGTGLGLAVAQQLVVRNGGVISVESEVDRGTRFHIDLPESAASERTPSCDAPDASPRLRIRRVLVVEDDPDVASGLHALLAAESVDVRVVMQGRDAVKVASSFRPEVVVIDISLPDMSGVAVYEQVVAVWPDIGVIFSTGHADAGLLPPSGRARVGFLRKPYSSETLIRMLREVS